MRYVIISFFFVASAGVLSVPSVFVFGAVSPMFLAYATLAAVLYVPSLSNEKRVKSGVKSGVKVG